MPQKRRYNTKTAARSVRLPGLWRWFMGILLAGQAKNNGKAVLDFSCPQLKLLARVYAHLPTPSGNFYSALIVAGGGMIVKI